MVSLPELPLEVLYTIIENTPFTTLLNLRKVSNWLKIAVDESRCIYSNLVFISAIANSRDPSLIKITLSNRTRFLKLQDIIDHKENGLTYWLEELKSVTFSGNCYSQPLLAERFEYLFETIMDILEYDLNRKSKLENLKIDNNISMEATCLSSVVERINECPIKFSACVVLDTTRSQHEISSSSMINLEEKFTSLTIRLDPWNDANEELLNWKLKADKSKLKELSITKLCTTNDEPISIDLLNLSLMVSKQIFLTKLTISVAKLKTYSTINGPCNFPPSIKNLVLHDCEFDRSTTSIFDNKFVFNGVTHLFIENVDEQLVENLRLPNIASLRIWDLDINSTTFLTDILQTDTLRSLTLDVKSWEVLGFLTSSSFIQSSISQLSLHIWNGKAMMEKLRYIKQLGKLERLMIYSDDVCVEPEVKEATKGLNNFLSSLVKDCYSLKVLDLFFGVSVPRICMMESEIEFTRKRALQGERIVREYEHPWVLDGENDELYRKLPSWLLI